MNEKQRAMYETRARIVKALAHPARLMVVDALAKQPMCVRDIRELVGSDLSTVSKHLSVMKNAGIVADEKRGAQVFYSLRCPCAVNFFSCAEKVFETAAKDQMRLVARK